MTAIAMLIIIAIAVHEVRLRNAKKRHRAAVSIAMSSNGARRRMRGVA